MEKEKNGKNIPCIYCNGSGLIIDYIGEPDECAKCGGSGVNWAYQSGKIARNYAGPFVDFIKA